MQAGGGVVTTVLQYLVIAAVIGGVAFAIAIFMFGRGEQMAALPPRTSPTELPDKGMTGQDVRSVRFAMAWRGYRMSDVDWALDRMANELDALRTQLAERRPVSVGVASDDLTERRAGPGPGDPAADDGPGGKRWPGPGDQQ